MSTPSLSGLVGDGRLDRVLELARRHLGMDVAFLAEFIEGKQVYRGLDGDADSFGWALDDGPALPETYCRLMTAGELPNAVPDARADARVRDLAVTTQAGIGSYVGVPIRLTDGSLYGSFCCLSHQAQPVDHRDVKFLALLAELVAEEVQAQRDAAATRAHLRRVIDETLIDIALQPIVDIDDGRMLGVEALSRFPVAYGPPDVVFAAAHAAGLGRDLERLAVARAFSLLPLLAPDQYLALNLTPAVAFEFSAHAADNSSIPYDRLVLEITEHAAVEGYAALRDRLAPVRRRGLRLAIDDAGAGYASLRHIVELAPDLIKIDRSLIDGLAADRARRSVVTAFVGLAADLDATVVAEGVETGTDLDTARELGVHAAQGYLLARPSTDRSDLARWTSTGVDLPQPRPTDTSPTQPRLPAQPGSTAGTRGRTAPVA